MINRLLIKLVQKCHQECESQKLSSSARDNYTLVFFRGVIATMEATESPYAIVFKKYFDNHIQKLRYDFIKETVSIWNPNST